MEEKKTLKIKKPYVIIFTLAIVFAILGFMDLNVWAMESMTEGPVIEEQYLNVDYYRHNYVNGGYVRDHWTWTSPNVRIALYYGDFTTNAYNPGDKNEIIKDTHKGYRLCVLRNEQIGTQYWYGRHEVINYDNNQNPTSNNIYESDYDFQLHHFENVPTSSENFGFGLNGMLETVNLDIDTNIPIFTDWNELRSYLETGTFYGEVDVSTFAYDDTLPIPQDITHSVEVVHTTEDDEYTRYALVNWKNTSNDYCIEVQLQPYASISSMHLPLGGVLFGERYEADFEAYGEWKHFELLDKGTDRRFYSLNNLLYDNADFVEWLVKCKKENLTSYMEKVQGKQFNSSLNYRIRYVDIDNKKVGSWVSVVMTDYHNGYHIYITDNEGNVINDKEFMNGYVHRDEQTGTSDNIDTEFIENGANNRQDVYEDIIDTNTGNTGNVGIGGIGSSSDVDVSQATNWLQGVASFIKGTPAFVGSVLSFLPQPILYGIYICIFLGVIAGGYAIIKALI